MVIAALVVSVLPRSAEAPRGVDPLHVRFGGRDPERNAIGRARA